jgi:hypothetical protein
MNPTDLRSRCEAIAGATKVPRPFGMDEFIDELARDRGRAIVVAEQSLPQHVSGVYVGLDDVDYILVTDRPIPRQQREHIILHEVAHILLAHDRPADADLRALFPSIDPDMIRMMLARGGGYNTPQEREAEMLASLLRQRTDPNLTGTLRAAWTYGRLYSLWHLMYDAIKEIALEDPPTSRRADALQLHNAEFRLYRRIIEIGDGLLHLSPYMNLPPGDWDSVAARAHLPRPAVVEAARIRAATGALSAARRSGAVMPAAAGITAGQPGPRGDVDWLLQVTRALRHMSPLLQS